MKNKYELLGYALMWLAAAAVVLLVGALSYWLQDYEGLSKGLMTATRILLVIPVGASLAAAVYSIVMLRKGVKAVESGEDNLPYLVKVHYTMPLALPLAYMGFSIWSIAFSILLVYSIYKWALPQYPWKGVKRMLFHSDGVSWTTTIITWVNLLFFISAGLIPLLSLLLIVVVLYIFGQSGAIEYMLNSANGVGGGSGSRTCSSCAFYSGGGCIHGHDESSVNCPYFS